MAKGTQGLDADLSKQADSCRRLGSPLYGELMRFLGELWSDPRDPFLRQHLEPLWKERAFAIWYERPLLLALALHEYSLREGPGNNPLAAAYPSCGGNVSRFGPHLMKDGLAALFASPESRELLRTGFVQTNEVSRGVVWLWPLAALAEKLPKEMILFDLGASAGLNLVADYLPIPWADAKGKVLSLAPIPGIVARIGYDREPIDVADPAQLRRLRASVWADDLPRLARLDEATRVAHALHARGEFRVERADLLATPARIREEVRRLGGRPAVIFHTLAADYLPVGQREDFERFLRDLLHELPEGSLWLEFETARARRGAALITGARRMELRAHWNLGGMLAHETLAIAAPHPLTLEIDRVALERLIAQA